jgi:hypothetical protein
MQWLHPNNGGDDDGGGGGGVGEAGWREEMDESSDSLDADFFADFERFTKVASAEGAHASLDADDNGSSENDYSSSVFADVDEGDDTVDNAAAFAAQIGAKLNGGRRVGQFASKTSHGRIGN